jgi:hypothetical protein
MEKKNRPPHLPCRSGVLCAYWMGSAKETDRTENSAILSVESDSAVILSLGQSGRCNISLAGDAQRHHCRAAAAQPKILYYLGRRCWRIIL